MNIEYAALRDSILRFPPNRDDRELLLAILKYLQGTTERPDNFSTYSYFIEKVGNEIEHADQ